MIGGGFAAAGELLLGRRARSMRREALEAAGASVRIVRAELGTRRAWSAPGSSPSRRSIAVTAALMPLAVCATPIGNLEDVTLRVLRELREADVVLCEDTRHTRRLLERHGIGARLLSYHEHNEATRMAELVPRLRPASGSRSSATPACPAISDPARG